MKKLNKVPMEIYGSLNILKMTAKVVKNTNISTLSVTEMGSELFYLETSFGNNRKQKKKLNLSLEHHMLQNCKI